MKNFLFALSSILLWTHPLNSVALHSVEKQQKSQKITSNSLKNCLNPEELKLILEIGSVFDLEITSETSLEDLNQILQKNFRQVNGQSINRPGLERSSLNGIVIKDDEKREKIIQALFPYFIQKKPIQFSKDKNNTVLILGSSLQSMRERLNFFLNFLKSCEKIPNQLTLVSLTGDRFYDPKLNLDQITEEEMTIFKELFPSAFPSEENKDYKITETHMLYYIWLMVTCALNKNCNICYDTQGQLIPVQTIEEIQEKSQQHCYEINPNCQMNLNIIHQGVDPETKRRPTTETTLNKLKEDEQFKDNIQNDRLIFISSQPDIVTQRQVIEKSLPDSDCCVSGAGLEEKVNNPNYNFSRIFAAVAGWIYFKHQAAQKK